MHFFTCIICVVANLCIHQFPSAFVFHYCCRINFCNTVNALLSIRVFSFELHFACEARFTPEAEAPRITAQHSLLTFSTPNNRWCCYGHTQNATEHSCSLYSSILSGLFVCVFHIKEVNWRNMKNRCVCVCLLEFSGNVLDFNVALKQPLKSYPQITEGPHSLYVLVGLEATTVWIPIKGVILY